MEHSTAASFATGGQHARTMPLAGITVASDGWRRALCRPALLTKRCYHSGAIPGSATSSRASAETCTEAMSTQVGRCS